MHIRSFIQAFSNLELLPGLLRGNFQPQGLANVAWTPIKRRKGLAPGAQQQALTLQNSLWRHFNRLGGNLCLLCIPSFLMGHETESLSPKTPSTNQWGSSYLNVLPHTCVLIRYSKTCQCIKIHQESGRSVTDVSSEQLMDELSASCPLTRVGVSLHRR